MHMCKVTTLPGPGTTLGPSLHLLEFNECSRAEQLQPSTVKWDTSTWAAPFRNVLLPCWFELLLQEGSNSPAGAGACNLNQITGRIWAEVLAETQISFSTAPKRGHDPMKQYCTEILRLRAMETPAVDQPCPSPAQAVSFRPQTVGLNLEEHSKNGLERIPPSLGAPRLQNIFLSQLRMRRSNLKVVF